MLPNVAITVEYMGEAGAVGFGRYIPPTDGQEVAITQTPTVTLSLNQQVNIGQFHKWHCYWAAGCDYRATKGEI
ncbi:hypothetical protein ACQKPX_19580 [Photobacterium sp. DNB23_23_1]